MDRIPMSKREKADWLFLFFAVAFFLLALLYSMAESPLLGLTHGPACVCDDCYDKTDRKRTILLDVYGNPIVVRFEGKLHRLDKIYGEKK